MLSTPLKDPTRLVSFVEDSVSKGCVLIGVYGPDAERIEEEVDYHLIMDFSAMKPRPEEWMDVVTTAHETQADALELAELWSGGSHEIEDVIL